MGCRGTHLAYIISATEVFQDIEQRFPAEEISIPSAPGLHTSAQLPVNISPQPSRDDASAPPNTQPEGPTPLQQADSNMSGAPELIAFRQQLSPRPSPAMSIMTADPQEGVDNLDAASLRVEARSSKAWFQELDKLNDVLQAEPKDLDADYVPMKIAILDNGVSEDFRNHVQGYKDFFTGNDDFPQDQTGLGTLLVKAVQRVFDKAHIFIVRVFSDSGIDPKSPDLMQQAIEHATNVWRVDIVAIS